jgi:EmrB/QacA subfamily drug resistance transporter
MKENNLVSENSLPTGYATRWKSLIFVCIALLPLSFDNTILNIALPTLANELNATTHQLQWVTDAYILAFASLLFTSGSIGDRYGRKRIFYIGLVLFGLGSVVVLGVTSINALIIVRAVLGFAASLIMPTTLSIINVNFPKEERPKALAIWGLVFMAGMLLGPILSGVLLRFFSWQSLFLINVPIVVIAFWGISRFLAESKNENTQRIDIMGAILSSAGLFCLIFGIIEAGLKGWTHPTVILFLALSIIFVAVFIWWEKRTPEPMLPMYLFKNMSLTVASLAMVLVTFSMAGGMFSFSLYMQTVLGYSALQAGLGILPMPIIMMVFTPIGLALMKKAGMKVSIGVGLALVAAGLFYMSWFYGLDTSFPVIVIGQILMASGMSITMTPATNSIMGAVPTAQSGIGSAMNNTTRELGNALGIAVLGTLINSSYLVGVQHLKDLLPQFSDQALAIVSTNIQTAHSYAQTLGVELGALVIKTADQAFVSGMSNAFTIGGIIMLCICVFTFLALPAKIQQSDSEKENQHKPIANKH